MSTAREIAKSQKLFFSLRTRYDRISLKSKVEIPIKYETIALQRNYLNSFKEVALLCGSVFRILA